MFYYQCGKDSTVSSSIRKMNEPITGGKQIYWTQDSNLTAYNTVLNPICYGSLRLSPGEIHPFSLTSPLQGAPRGRDGIQSPTRLTSVLSLLWAQPQLTPAALQPGPRPQVFHSCRHLHLTKLSCSRSTALPADSLASFMTLFKWHLSGASLSSRLCPKP